jgi:hypothetical protein
MLNLTDAQKKYIQDIVEGIPFLSFNYTTGTFDVSDSVPDPTWEQIQLLYKAVGKLSKNRPPPPSFCSVRLDQLITGYYDRCLEYYCYERLNLQIPHEQTCWVRFAEKTFCLGRVDPGTHFDDETKVQFMESLGRERRDNYIAMSIYRAYHKNPELRHALKKDEEGWLMFLADVSIGPLHHKERIKTYIKNLLKKILRSPNDDRVLKIVQSIEAYGWDNDLAWVLPEGGAVLGYSRTTKRYFALTGRHRIAAVKYLHSQGKISGSTRIEFPVITYPWGSWMQGRPHPDSPVCEWCK